MLPLTVFQQLWQYILSEDKALITLKVSFISEDTAKKQKKLSPGFDCQGIL